MDTENRLTVVKVGGVGGWVRRVEGLSKEKKENLMDTDNSMMMARGKWG